MTYEPGQQVLVRGVIGVVRDREILVRFTNHVGVKFGVHFAPADVVGPAPATGPPLDIELMGEDEWVEHQMALRRRREIVGPAPATHPYAPTKDTEIGTCRCGAQWNDPVHGGPTPATPDEGEPRSAAEVRADAAEADVEHYRDEANEAVAALAAAEARIAAALIEHFQVAPLDCGCCGVLWPCPTVRALSVEAAGTEGGDGHE
jgi:hypothetical protein